MSDSLKVDSVVARAAVIGTGRPIEDSRVFALAMRLANPQLADRIATCHATAIPEPPKLAQTMAAYRLRALHRATPFGLFAGAGPVAVASSGPVVRPSRPIACLRPDCEWLDFLVAGFEADPGVLLDVHVGLRPPFSVHGDRVYKPAETSVEVGFSRSVRYTPVLRQIMTALLGGARRVEELYDDLDQLGLSQKPDTIAFAGYVGQLIKFGLLVSQLSPASSSTAPLCDIASALKERCPADAKVLLDLHDAMGVVPMAEVLDRIESLRARSECLSFGATHGSGSAFVQVDTVYRQAGSIPASLVRQTVRHACLLDRIALRRGMSTQLRAWHRDLVERFGVDRSVPLLVATDPVAGVGLPRWGAVPDPDPDEPARQRLCQVLLRRALPGPRTGEVWEVAIGDQDLPESEPDTPHPSRDVCLDVYFEPGGRYVLTPSVVGGSAAPGAFSGRLRAALDAVTQGGASADLSRLVTRPSRVLDFRGPQPRSGNVNRPTDVHNATLAIDHVPTRTTDSGLPDVSLVATLDGISLCEADGAPCAISYSALLTRKSTPGIVRLLMEIAESRGPRWVPWTWGTFAALPRTPRVVYDDVIVCRAQWTVPDTVRAAAGGPRFASSVQQWRAECAVPDIVQVGDGTDQILPLDIASNSTHLAILERMLLRDGTVAVREDLLSELTCNWGQAQHMELVLSMTASATREVQQ